MPSTAATTTSRHQVAHSHANTALSYRYGKTSGLALLRTTSVQPTYTLVSDESHARQRRAFYPHRRSQGSFALTFEFMNWHEFNQAMAWFRDYAELALQTGNTQAGIPMSVFMAARNFSRSGIPTTGLEYGDHTASMVWSPTVTFVSVNDTHDPSTSIIASKAASREDASGVDRLAANFFYPDSAVNRPGALDESLYGPSGLLPPPSSAVQRIINGGRPPSLGRPGIE